MQRLSLGLGVIALALLTAACSGATAADPTPTAPTSSGGPSAAPGDAILVVAQDLAFATDQIAAPADTPFEIVLDNREDVPHNIAIKDGTGTAVFKGEIVSKTTVTNVVPALPAGTYAFWCEIHPDMAGTLTAG